MADVKKVATRQSYGEALKELGAAHPDVVVLDADLANATKTEIFKKAFPDRHFDCGIAESDMMCVAAGLSTTGYVPFASSFAMFAAGRAFEQVRNSIGYPHLNVKIGATHGGISVGEDGASPPCCEDFALMRSTGQGKPCFAMTAHTASPSPPMMECSSQVTSLPHSFAAFSTRPSSSGLMVAMSMTRALIPCWASSSAASSASATSRPLAMRATSEPSRRTSPFPISKVKRSASWMTGAPYRLNRI